MQRARRVYEQVMHVVPFAPFADSGFELFDLGQVAPADLPRAGEQLFGHLEPVEFDHPLERELQLEGVHDVEDDHFVAAEAEVLDTFEDSFLIVEEIADENDDALAADLAGGFMEDGGDGGLAGGVE